MRVTKRQSRQCAGLSWITTQRGNGEDQDWNSYMGRSSAGGGTAQREIAEV
jgi:hypothetical protein